MRMLSLLVLLPALATGCSRPVPPHDGTLSGAISVDDRTENAFLLETRPTHDLLSLTYTLVAVSPDTGKLTSMMDMDGRSDLRLLFPKSGVLAMSQASGQGTLALFDQSTLAPLRQADTTVRYDAAHLSPSRSWISVDDTIIDATSLEQFTVPHDGGLLQGMWMHQSDRLMIIVFYDEAMPTEHARILSWDMSQVAAAGFMPDSSGFWPMPAIDIDLPGIGGPGVNSPDLSSFDWFNVSPDDHWVVFPVKDFVFPPPGVAGSEQWTADLLVLDTTTGTVRTVPHAMGPAIFTPDSTTFVASNDVFTQGQELSLIDASTLAAEPVPVPMPVYGSASYFVSDDGKDVVVNSINGGPFVLYDIDHGTTTQVSAPASLAPSDMVSRPGTRQVWFLLGDELFELDLAAGSLTHPPTDASPLHLNILPKHNRLVLDEAYFENGDALAYYDPDAQTTALLVTPP
jgi:hypothetical protein